MTTPPKTLTVIESNALLDALFGKNRTSKQKQRGIRNFAMGLLMLDAGLRVGELVKLRQCDLLGMGGIVSALVITGDIAKGGRERTIPLSSRIRHVLNTLQSNYWKKMLGHSTEFAFYEPNTGCPLTTRQVERIVRHAAMIAIGRPVHPHVLRHTFASRLMRTTNARVVQELLGHQHLTTTQIYTHPNQEDMKTAIENLDRRHPDTTYLPSPRQAGTNLADDIDTGGTGGDVT